LFARALVSECIASESARTPLLSARILDGGSRTTTTGAPPAARTARAEPTFEKKPNFLPEQLSEIVGFSFTIRHH
jgi:hypothetical protein